MFKKRIFFILLIIFIIFLYYYPFISSTDTFLSSDLINIYAPVLKYAVDNNINYFNQNAYLPEVNCGTPADRLQAITLAYNPFIIYFYIFNFFLALNLYILSHIILTAIFCFLFFELIMKSRIIALAGSLAFCFSAVFLSKIYAGHIAVLISITFFCISLYYIEKYFITKSIFYLFILTFISPFFIKSGHPQIILYAAVFIIIQIILRLIMHMPNKKKNIRNLIIAAGLIIIVNIGNITILKKELMDQEVFSSPDKIKNIAEKLNPLQLINIILPDAAGQPENLTNLYEITNQYWEKNCYAGIIIVILCLSSLFYINNKYIILFFAPGSVALILSVFSYSYLYPLIIKIPYLNSGRNFSRWSIFFSFSIITLSLHSLKNIIYNNSPKKKYLVISLIILIFAGIYYYFVTFNINTHITFFNYFKLFLKSRLIYIILMSIFFLLFIHIKKKNYRIFFIISLFIGDLIFINNKLVQHIPLTETPLISQKIPKILKNNKVRLGSHKNLSNIEILSYSNLIANKVNTTGSFTENLLSKKYSRFQKFYNPDDLYAAQTPYNLNTNFTEVLGVRYILSKKKLHIKKLQLTPFPISFVSDKYFCYSISQGFLYKNTKAFPLFFVTNKVQYIENENKILLAIKNNKLAGKFCYVSKKINVGQYEPNYSISNINWSKRNTSLSLNVFTDKKSLLAILYKFEPRWSVTVNDKPGRIIKVNYLFMGIPMNKGNNKIQLNFKDTYQIYNYISNCSTLLILLLCIFMAIRNKNSTLKTNTTCKINRFIIIIIILLFLIFIKWNKSIADYKQLLKHPPFSKDKLKELIQDYKIIKSENRIRLLKKYKKYFD